MLFHGRLDFEESSFELDYIHTPKIPRGATPRHTPPPHSETIHTIHLHTTKKVDQNQEGEHSRDQEQSRNTKGKYHSQDDPTKEEEKITQKDIEDAKNNKDFMKMREVLLREEKERYLLELAKQGAKTSH